VLLSAALAGFLLLAGTGGGSVHESVDRLPAVIAGVLGGLATVSCVLLGRRRPGGAESAALFGVAVGIIYAATAALLKTVTDIAVRDRLGLLGAWQLYAVILLGVGGLLLNQLAFQAGPITASLPAIATIDPLLSIVIGVLVYDEHLRRGPAGGALLVILLLLLSVAVVQLTRVADREISTAPHAAGRARAR
jgi:drug/metabolite transporter (DMT)-like permease